MVEISDEHHEQQAEDEPEKVPGISVDQFDGLLGRECGRDDPHFPVKTVE